MKKEIKKHIKEDEFVSIVTKTIRFFKTHQKTMLAAAAGILVVVLLIVGIRFLRDKALQKQSKVVTDLLSLRADLDKDPGNLAKLEKLAGDRKFERVAYVLLGTYWLEKGDLGQAEAALLKIKDRPRDLTYYQARDLLGQVSVLRKDYDKAIKIFDQVEKDKPAEFALDAVLSHKAEALEKKGDKAGALVLYKKLQEEYNQTYYGYEASLKVRKLEAGE